MAHRFHLFGDRCARTMSHNHGRGSGKNPAACSLWCYAKCHRGLGCDEGQPWLAPYGRHQILECAFEVKETVRSFTDGAPRDGEHVVYLNNNNVAKKVQVVEWYEERARIRVPGTVGDKLRGIKRQAAYDQIVDRGRLKRIVPRLSEVEPEYFARRAGIQGSLKARRKQVAFELRRIKLALPLARPAKNLSFRECLLHPDKVQWR
jgi:hypothetical protein